MSTALDEVSMQSARSLSIWMAVLFTIFIATDRLLFDAPANLVLPVFDAFLAAACFGLWVLIRAGRVPLRHARTAAGGLLLVALPYILTVLWVSEEPLQSSGLALWQVASGMFLLSWPWLLGLLVASDVLWLGVVQDLPPSPDYADFGTLLLSANILAVVAHGVRLRTYRRLETLRLADRAKQSALAQALAEGRELHEVRRINLLKTRFMNVAAHELATPMTPILIQVHLLQAMQGRLPEEGRRAVTILERGVSRLNVLLRDILDGARLQADRLPMAMAPLAFSRLLEDCVETYIPVARERGIALRLEAPADLRVAGDAGRLAQVVTNLLSNAVKFAQPGGTVTVRAALVDGQVRTEFRDDGLGFEPSAADQLFQPFSQLHEPDPERRGSGLGLYILRGIVERHGGAVGAESGGPGQGACFHFTLPAQGETLA